MKRALILITLFFGIAPLAHANVIQFTFTGSIDSFYAFQPGPFGAGMLPAVVSPGDAFIGTAFFDEDADPLNRSTVGYSIYSAGRFLLGGATYIGRPDLPQYSFLTPTELFVDCRDPIFGGPYSTYSTARGGALLTLLLDDGSGHFSYDGDTGAGVFVDVSGTISSIAVVSDTTSSLWLIPPVIFLIGTKRFRILQGPG